MSGVDSMDVQSVAFYLPQFHPIAENDEWWGKGFTEWTNVTRSRPLFANHYQPHLPADLGFYDLRLPEVRIAQAELARQYGVTGFCYYHYWFHGRRLLERPSNEMLASGQPDFPFCFCWANESWGRGWLGQDKTLLVEQTYSREDDLKHARWLAEAFCDPRHIRVDGRPLFLIYRPGNLPEPRFTVDAIKEAGSRAGSLEPLLVGIDATHQGFDFREWGFDANLSFQPQLSLSGPGAFDDRFRFDRLVSNLRNGIPSGRLKLFEDREARQRMDCRPRTGVSIPCTYVGWDNSPRRGRRSIIYRNGGPSSFRVGLGHALDAARDLPFDRPLLFINAWNEWAEGNHLEPDQKYGHAYLEEVKQALADEATMTDAPGQKTLQCSP